jgi:hypothetical protein
MFKYLKNMPVTEIQNWPEHFGIDTYSVLGFFDNNSINALEIF